MREYAAILAALLLLADVSCAADDPHLVVQAQSVECHYGEGDEPPCTVRLHARVKEGSSFAEIGGVSESPLVGVDAAGRVLIGHLRGWEPCMENCRTLVYDFDARPQGGWIEFNTEIEVGISTGFLDMPPLEFNPRQAAGLNAAGMSFFFTPVPTPEGESHSTVYFRVEYEMSPSIRQIVFCDARGKPCPTRIVGGEYSESHELTCATYVIRLDENSTAHMQLRLHKPAVPCRASVRFRAYMGLVTDPAP